MRFLSALVLTSFVLFGCADTYQRDNMKQDVKDIAKKEYKLDVRVEDVGDTLGVQFRIKNMLGELVAEDQLLWTQMEELMMVLSRVVLSSDKPPKFIVLDVVDEENPRLHLYFTRYVVDLQKLMGEALSRTQFLDRLIMEFDIGGKRIIFDPYEMDMVRLMMMTVDVENEKVELTENFNLKEVDFADFVSKVTSNTMRRMLRERRDVQKSFSLRTVDAKYDVNKRDQGQFKILLDLVSNPRARIKPSFVESKLLPFVAKEVGKVLKSYKFNAFSNITVIEKNSGKIFTMGRK